MHSASTCEGLAAAAGGRFYKLGANLTRVSRLFAKHSRADRVLLTSALNGSLGAARQVLMVRFANSFVCGLVKSELGGLESGLDGARFEFVVSPKPTRAAF